MKSLHHLMFCLILLFGAVRVGFSRGDKIIPQVVDGPGWSTKFDLSNISSSPYPDLHSIHVRMAFFTNNGTAWDLQTNKGTRVITLTLAPRQTVRVETLGGANMGAGYAVIYDDEESNSEYSEDFVLGISVFYQYSTSSGVVDTVTVSVPQPTRIATAPMQMNGPQGIYSGLAIANLAGSSNEVTMDLYSEDGTLYGTRTINLATSEQWGGYLDNSTGVVLFPELKNQPFKGMAEIRATGPVAFLGLLQTRAANGEQYSTLVPVDKESLRRNTYIVVLQASLYTDHFMPLDVDGFTVDYFRNNDGYEDYPWDLAYEFGTTTDDIYLQPYNGAGLALLGVKDDIGFDTLSLADLKATTYSSSAINLSGSVLKKDLTFAIRTDLRNYAKARVARIIDTTDDNLNQYKDIVLEVSVYK